jgi:hypothetical protein
MVHARIGASAGAGRTLGPHAAADMHATTSVTRVVTGVIAFRSTSMLLALTDDSIGGRRCRAVKPQRWIQDRGFTASNHAKQAARP